MNWFKSRARIRSHAVLSPYLNGVAALLVQDDGDRARVLAFAHHETRRYRPMRCIGWRRKRASNAPLIALLGQESYQTMMVEAPSVPDDEIKSAIRWKVKDLLNFHVDDAVLDHLPVPGGGGRPASLYVVAAQAGAIRALAQPYQDAGLQLDVIDIRETAQHNLAMRIARPITLSPCCISMAKTLCSPSVSAPA